MTPAKGQILPLICANCGMQSKCHEGGSTGDNKQGSVTKQSKVEKKLLKVRIKPFRN